MLIKYIKPVTWTITEQGGAHSTFTFRISDSSTSNTVSEALQSIAYNLPSSLSITQAIKHELFSSDIAVTVTTTATVPKEPTLPGLQNLSAGKTKKMKKIMPEQYFTAEQSIDDFDIKFLSILEERGYFIVSQGTIVMEPGNFVLTTSTMLSKPEK